MKHKNKVIILTLVLVFTLTTVLCLDKFRISKFNRSPDEEFKFLILTERSLEQCVDECTRRKSCQAVGYHTLYHLCELFTSPTATFTTRGHSVMVTREDMKIHDQEGDAETNNTCEEWEVFETISNEAECVRKECKPPTSLENGRYLGNMNQIGSKKAVICDQGYVEEKGIKSIECMSNGSWDYIPTCKNYSTGMWINFRSSQIQIQIQNLNHSEAKEVCESNGTKLIKIDEPWKMDFIAALLQNVPGQYWVDGLKDHTSDDAWKFSDDTSVPMDKYLWKSHAPNGGDGENCFRMVQHGGDNIGDYRFDDTTCDKMYHFICEKTMP